MYTVLGLGVHSKLFRCLWLSTVYGLGFTQRLHSSSFLGLPEDPKYKPQQGTTREPMGRAI